MRNVVILLTGTLVIGCGERSRTPPPGGTDSSPAVSVPDSAPVQRPPAPLAAFPLDRDTMRFKRQLAQGGSQIPACGTRVPRITGDSIGPFRLGETIAELRSACPRLLYGWVEISDGYAVPTVAVRLGGAMVTAFASDSLESATLSKVEVMESGLRTTEGFGVGSMFAQLTAAYGAYDTSESDCIFRMWFSSRPGLAFHMEYPAGKARECGSMTAAPFPPDLRVRSVILVPQ